MYFVQNILEKNKQNFCNLFLLLLFILFGHFSYFAFSAFPKLPRIFFCFNFIYWVPFFYYCFEKKRISISNYVFIFISLLISNINLDYHLPIISIFLWSFLNILNTSLQFIILFFSLKKKSKTLKVWSFIFGWITLEIILDTIFRCTLFNIGYRLSLFPEIIQFYEIIGVYGGSLLILSFNLFIYLIFSNKFKLINKNVIFSFLIILIVILLNIYSILKKKNDFYNNKINIQILHTNLDCYNEKYNLSQSELDKIYNSEILKYNLDSTDLIVLPETSITEMGWLKYYNYYNNFKNRFKLVFEKNNKILILCGGRINSNVDSPSNYEKLTKRLFYSNYYKTWYKQYNVAFILDNYSNIKLHTKKILVPFEEYNPIPFLPNFLASSLSFSNFSEDLENENSTFKIDSSTSILPLICYESYVENYVSGLKSNYGVIIIMLNEGWYIDNISTNLYYAHSIVRAIEHNKYVIRSSNKGISSVINNEGKTLVKCSKNNFENIFYKTPILTRVTIYSQISMFIKSLFILIFVVFLFIKRKYKKINFLSLFI